MRRHHSAPSLSVGKVHLGILLSSRASLHLMDSYYSLGGCGRLIDNNEYVGGTATRRLSGGRPDADAKRQHVHRAQALSSRGSPAAPRPARSDLTP